MEHQVKSIATSVAQAISLADSLRRSWFGIRRLSACATRFHQLCEHIPGGVLCGALLREAFSLAYPIAAEAHFNRERFGVLRPALLYDHVVRRRQFAGLRQLLQRALEIHDPGAQDVLLQ